MLQDLSMSMPAMPTTPPLTPISCPEDGPLNLVFIGNSYTGGTSIGRACNSDGSNRPECESKAVPGNVRGFYQDPPELYPGKFDAPPDSDTLIDPTQPYNPSLNPHLGDVPTKIKILAEYFCSNGMGNTFEYVQNTQSAFTTRTHAGEAGGNPQSGTLFLLNSTSINPPQGYDVVVIQPQSTKYLDGASSSRVSALEELTRPRSAASPSVRFVLQQTWPRRESTNFNQICTIGEKKGMLEEIGKTIAEFEALGLGPFQVAPTGTAFLDFAGLACGPDIFPMGECAFNSNVSCPIWYGEAGKVSLYAEDTTEEGTHQSEEVGAWLAAAVLYGIVQPNPIPCYVSESDLSNVMPTVPDNLADIPTGQSLYYLIAEAARLALVSEFGTVVRCAVPVS
jgi:hypothetical protein